MARTPLEHPYDASMSVVDALDAYLAENGFSREEYDKPEVTVNFWGMRFTVPNPPSRKLAVRFHDLHHVMTGYGTDPAGEFEISAWELRRGIGVFGAYVRLIITTGCISGLFVHPRRTIAAWRRASRTPRLPAPSMNLYEELSTLSVGDLRTRYGVALAGVTGVRALHADAPT